MRFGHLPFVAAVLFAGHVADTREAFEEAGNVFDPKTAEKMKKFILAPGNSTDRAEAYRQFRGRDPDVKALLKKRGFRVDTHTGGEKLGAKIRQALEADSRAAARHSRPSETQPPAQ